MSPTTAWLPPDLAFTAEHLAANRAGVLHPEQRARLEALRASQLDGARRAGRTGCVIALLVLIVPAIFAFAVASGSTMRRRDATPFVVRILLGAFAVALVPGAVGLLARRKRAALEAGLGDVAVVRFEGPIQKRRYATKGGPVHEITVDTFKMTVPAASWSDAPELRMVRLYAAAPRPGLSTSGFLSLEDAGH